MLTVANPIYDVVFKYLMEDMRIATTILSALLQRKVTDVTVRPHEYSNTERDTLSVFRIDFSAYVTGDDGQKRLILIEIQKTWLETETLRFRQYLGVQYSNPENMMKGENKNFALPMVAVYLLGHRVGNIDQPVIYVGKHVCDSLGQLVTKGLPDPFVDSLNHNCIIVQIPLLSGRVNSRLYEVLSIFDQSRKDKQKSQMINIEDGAYDGDKEMEYIVRRLQAAASDNDVRRKMTVEDEYFSVIENRDTTIMMKDRTIAEKNAEIKEKNAEIEKNMTQLKQMDAQLEQMDAQLEQKDAQLEQKDAQLEQKDAQLEQKDAQLEQKDETIRKSVSLLSMGGLPIEAIAENLNMSIDEVKALINT